jgi:glycosyltransferase involved in cell wall biosynthesis
VKRVLIVGMIESVHMARAVSQYLDGSYNVYVIPGVRVVKPHSLLASLHSQNKLRILLPLLSTNNKYILLFYKAIYRFVPKFNKLFILICIKLLKPALVHSMEIQEAGYAVLGVAKRYQFPWLVTNWGSDIFLFNKFPEHQELIADVLKRCDFYSCECIRDVELVKKLGYKGQILPVFPNAGGLDFSEIDKVLDTRSKRFRITIKGYNGWSGRAVFALKALEMIASEITDYVVTIYSATEDTRIAAKLFEEKTNLNVEIINHTSHEDILKVFSETEIYIGLSISDGVSTSCLEAMALGAFPIQSNSSCCMEWFIDNVSGFAVDAENTQEVSGKILRILNDKEFIFKGRQINYQICKEKLDKKIIRAEFVKNYKTCLGL